MIEYIITMDKKKFGDHGEDIACIFLKERGHIIIARNYTCKIGEIDIISSYKNNLYVSEVKTRTSNEFGNPYESVNYIKKNKIFSVYQNYCAERRIDSYSMKFLVISIIIDKSAEVDIECFEDIWG